MVQTTSVIPEILKGLSGTHGHSPIRIVASVWAPVFRVPRKPG
jgi:hypothetical protein